jgi:hypothetical protein
MRHRKGRFFQPWDEKPLPAFQGTLKSRRSHELGRTMACPQPLSSIGHMRNLLLNIHSFLELSTISLHAVELFLHKHSLHLLFNLKKSFPVF